jgi:hypothetical protein
MPESRIWKYEGTDSMKNEELFSSRHDIGEEIDSHNKKDPGASDEETDPLEEETDPHILELIERAWELQKQLDPLVREAMRDHPEKLAAWDEIRRMCDDIKPEDDHGSDKS